MYTIDKRFPNTSNLFPGFYSVRYIQKEQLTELANDPNRALELALVLKRNFKTQNWTEISENVPILLKLVKNEDEQVRYEALLSIKYVCINYDSNISYYQVFKELGNTIEISLNSEYKELRLEMFKLLSITFEKRFADDYIPFLDPFDKYLEIHVDEEAMTYIMEILLGMFDKLSEEMVLKFMFQVCGIIEKAVENDLIEYCLNYLNRIIDYKLGKFCVQAIQKKLGFSLINLLGNPKFFDTAFKMLQRLSQYPEMVPVFKDAICFVIGLFYNQPIEVKHFASSVMVIQAAQGFENLENLINKNFIPTLVSFLTTDDMKIKNDMILIVKSFFRQQLQHQIIELLENNCVNILCRIIERDKQNRANALECMEVLLNGGNEIFKSFADSCRFSKLLVQIGIEPESNEIATRILKRHYPKAPLPPVNNQTIAQGIFAPLPPKVDKNQQSANPHPVFANTVLTNHPPLGQPAIAPANNLNINSINAGSIVNPIPQGNNLQTPINQTNIPTTKKNKPTPKKNKQKKAHVTTKSNQKAYKQTKIILKGAGKVKGKASKGNAVTIFPSSRIYKKFKETRLRVSRKAAVYLCGVFDYLCSEVIQLAKPLLKERKIIKPQDILQALKFDYELDKLIDKVILPESGNRNHY